MDYGGAACGLRKEFCLPDCRVSGLPIIPHGPRCSDFHRPNWHSFTTSGRLASWPGTVARLGRLPLWWWL